MKVHMSHIKTTLTSVDAQAQTLTFSVTDHDEGKTFERTYDWLFIKNQLSGEVELYDGCCAYIIESDHTWEEPCTWEEAKERVGRSFELCD